MPSYSDKTEDADHLLYVSLLILGLEPAALECKLKTPVNEKCFSQINRRLGDAILHFLFVCLDRERAGKMFRDCWPILDKKHESQFYKAAFEYYKTIQQSYRQPVPTVMGKTFMAPGGPRFTSTLMTLSRTALHAWITKRDPRCPILNAPNYSRCQEQNWQSLRIVQALKVAHAQHYIEQQETRQSLLYTLKNKAKDLCSKYRRLQKEGERGVAEFMEALNNNVRLSQPQREMFASASSATIQKALSEDITRMNETLSKLWTKVDKYLQVEESSWKVLCPLLDGSTAFSHINGAVYSPQVPEMVCKTQPNEINKLKLQGLYCEGKLDLLSIVQYSNLALSSLLDTSHNTCSHRHTGSCDQMESQSGLVTSLDETVNQLNDRLTSLLPTFNHALTSNLLRTSSFLTSERIELEKEQLCPPTPPFTLWNKHHEPVICTSHVPLQLTPRCVERPNDSDILSDAIQEMNITKRLGNLIKSKDCPSQKDRTMGFRQFPIQFQQNNNQHSEPSQLTDAPCTDPKLSGCSRPLEENVSIYRTNDSFRLERMDSPLTSFKPVTLQRKTEPDFTFEKLTKDAVPDLQERLSSVTKTPLRNHWSPVDARIPLRFDGFDVSPGNNCLVSRSPSDRSFESKKLSELRDHSKVRLSYFNELKDSNQKYNSLMLPKDPQELPSKPSFMSYVENMKKVQAATTPLKKSNQTERNDKLKTFGSNIVDSQDAKTNGCPTQTVNKEYYDNFTRMQNLLNLDQDITNITSGLDEVFVSPKDGGHQFGSKARPTSFLPESSVFDTLTDSILGGELDPSVLTDKNVGKQIRRESLSSRRQSVSNKRRLSLESRRYSEEHGPAKFGFEDCSGILDVSDCCLLSTSFEEE